MDVFVGTKSFIISLGKEHKKYVPQKHLSSASAYKHYPTTIPRVLATSKDTECWVTAGR